MCGCCISEVEQMQFVGSSGHMLSFTDHESYFFIVLYVQMSDQSKMVVTFSAKAVFAWLFPSIPYYPSG